MVEHWAVPNHGDWDIAASYISPALIHPPLPHTPPHTPPHTSLTVSATLQLKAMSECFYRLLHSLSSVVSVRALSVGMFCEMSISLSAIFHRYDDSGLLSWERYEWIIHSSSVSKMLIILKPSWSNTFQLYGFKILVLFVNILYLNYCEVVRT